MTTERVPYEEKLTEYLNSFVQSSPIKQFQKHSLRDTYQEMTFSDLDMFEKLELDSLFNNFISEFSSSPAYLQPYTNKSKTFSNSVVIFGAGGVTSWFLPQLIKIFYNFLVKLYGNDLSFAPEITITLIDGDVCESKNLLRQNFIPEDVGLNKAEVLAKRYSEIYPKVKVNYISKYFYYSPFFKTLDLDIPSDFLSEDIYEDFYINFKPKTNRTIINLVDNELTKHMIDFMIAKEYYSNSCFMMRYFSVGCDVYNGTVYTTLTGDSLYSLDFKESTYKIDDGSIHQESCAEVAEVQTVEQTFDSNTMGANILATLFSNYMANPLKLETQKVEFTSTAQPKAISIKKSNIDVIKLKVLYEDMYSFYIKSYLQRYGEFLKTPKSLQYKRVSDFLHKYMNI